MDYFSESGEDTGTSFSDSSLTIDSDTSSISSVPSSPRLTPREPFFRAPSPNSSLWLVVSDPARRQQLLEEISLYGDVKLQRIHRNFIFVLMASAEQALSCVDALRGLTDVPVEVGNPSSSLLVHHQKLTRSERKSFVPKLVHRFSEFGIIESHRSLSRATYINFTNFADAWHAGFELHQQMFCDLPLYIMYQLQRWIQQCPSKLKTVRRSRQLFVGNIPRSWNDWNLIKRFSLFGEIQQVRSFLYSHYAFITFRSQNVATEVFTNFSQRPMVAEGHHLAINYASPPTPLEFKTGVHLEGALVNYSRINGVSVRSVLMTAEAVAASNLYHSLHDPPRSPVSPSSGIDEVTAEFYDQGLEQQQQGEQQQGERNTTEEQYERELETLVQGDRPETAETMRVEPKIHETPGEGPVASRPLSKSKEIDKRMPRTSHQGEEWQCPMEAGHLKSFAMEPHVSANNDRS